MSDIFEIINLFNESEGNFSNHVVTTTVNSSIPSTGVPPPDVATNPNMDYQSTLPMTSIPQYGGGVNSSSIPPTTNSTNYVSPPYMSTFPNSHPQYRGDSSIPPPAVSTTSTTSPIPPSAGVKSTTSAVSNKPDVVSRKTYYVPPPSVSYTHLRAHET